MNPHKSVCTSCACAQVEDRKAARGEGFALGVLLCVSEALIFYALWPLVIK